MDPKFIYENVYINSVNYKGFKLIKFLWIIDLMNFCIISSNESFKIIYFNLRTEIKSSEKKSSDNVSVRGVLTRMTSYYRNNYWNKPKNIFINSTVCLIWIKL